MSQADAGTQGGETGVRRCEGTHDCIVVRVWMHDRELRIWGGIVEHQCGERLMHIVYMNDDMGAHQGEQRIFEEHIIEG